MSNQQYKNIGKKQIINVINQIIHQQKAIEVTLNLLIKFVDKDNKFNEYMEKELGGKNETSGDGETDTKGDTPTSTED
tara:strand:+ start:1438 stop:1671 length:234 start_codon:yes stop_codon:yes gene_type:complete